MHDGICPLKRWPSLRVATLLKLLQQGTSDWEQPLLTCGTYDRIYAHLNEVSVIEVHMRQDGEIHSI